MANITLSEKTRETLQHIAATCPLRSSVAHAVPTSKDAASLPCDLETIEVLEEKDEGLAFACHHTDGGICAGYLAVD